MRGLVVQLRVLGEAPVGPSRLSCSRLGEQALAYKTDQHRHSAADTCCCMLFSLLLVLQPDCIVPAAVACVLNCTAAAGAFFVTSFHFHQH